MPRYRALSSGNPLAPWQATRELALQAAIEAGEGNRDPHSGTVFLPPGVVIEEGDGEEPLTPDMALWAEALALIRQHGDRARDYATVEIKRLAGDAPRRARWRMIRKRVDQIMAAAAWDARR